MKTKHFLYPVCLGLLWAMLPQGALAKTYRLDIARKTVNITGTPVQKFTVNGQLPGPTLHFTEGEKVTIEVVNHMGVPTSVHWHGLLVANSMDGVPGFGGYPGIAPHSTFTYRFTLRQSGTYWYHAHTMTQEQDGLYGAIVIKPKGRDHVAADRDDVVLLSDFMNTPSQDILKNLKADGDYYNYARRTLGDFARDISRNGFWATVHDRLMWGRMRMSPTDLTDVSGYTFLTNGKTPGQNWTALFRPGQKVRLRFINASAMSFFDVRIPGLDMRVVAADGQDVKPVRVNEFRFGPAETYDVIVIPAKPVAYRIVAEPIDRTGFALATLAPRPGMVGPMPKHRPRALLTMADMARQNMPMAMPMHHMSMPMSMPKPSGGWADTGLPKGEKALSYADLRSAFPQPDTRKPDRTIDVVLGGNMERYVWTINGQTFAHAKPIVLRYGERVRLQFINKTMMAHPMHLHGMFVQLENGQPARWLPNKHTVVVAPGQRYSVLLTANEPGEWAFHCHMLYHMAAGMMTKVVVATLPVPATPAAGPKPSQLEGTPHAHHM